MNRANAARAAQAAEDRKVTQALMAALERQGAAIETLIRRTAPPQSGPAESRRAKPDRCPHPPSTGRTIRPGPRRGRAGNHRVRTCPTEDREPDLQLDPDQRVRPGAQFRTRAREPALPVFAAHTTCDPNEAARLRARRIPGARKHGLRSGSPTRYPRRPARVTTTFRGDGHQTLHLPMAGRAASAPRNLCSALGIRRGTRGSPRD